MIINGKLEGLWEEYYEFPYFMKTMNRFRNGLLDGKQISWHPNGQLHSMIDYVEGHLHGEVKLFDTSRILIFRARFEAGKCINVEVDLLSDRLFSS